LAAHAVDSFCVVAVALVMAYATIYVPLMALDSAVSTVFTCWLIDEEPFRDHVLYEPLKAAWDKLHDKKTSR
jgi:hypothetical protein